MFAYEWDEFKDHIWLAVDCCQNVAVFTCSVAKGLPYWIQVPDSEMQNVDEELSTLPSFAQIEGITDQVLYIESHGSESCNFPRSWALKGLFYYDYTFTRDTQCFYECNAAPVPPLHVDLLPPRLQMLAKHFVVKKCFAPLSYEDMIEFERRQRRPFDPIRNILPDDFA